MDSFKDNRDKGAKAYLLEAGIGLGSRNSFDAGFDFCIRTEFMPIDLLVSHIFWMSEDVKNKSGSAEHFVIVVNEMIKKFREIKNESNHGGRRVLDQDGCGKQSL